MNAVQWIGVVGVLTAALGAGAWFGGKPPAPPPLSVASTAGTSAASGSITVHLAGAVRRPGLVEVAIGARVADAVAAAGGAAADADLDALNLAAPLADGQQVVVPRRGAGAAAAPAGDGRVRLNQASAEELQTLPGVGPVTAAQIIAHRDQHGPFTAVEDLLDVPGIGEGKLAALRDAVVVP